jgi:23S rRNA pseudouridine1911/1915/1917 synthase
MKPLEQIFDWVYEEKEMERIDKFIAKESEDFSRSQVQQWIKDGNVLVNGQVVKPNQKLHENDQVILKIPPPIELHIEAEEMDLAIVYEDTDVVVINKPRGLVVHPAPGHYSGTLVNGLLAHCHDLSGINGVLRPGIVHRIDKDTSGLIMVAKNDKAHLSLAQQLKDHTVNRRYIAIVHGKIQHDKGTIEAPIGRDPVHRQQMAVVSGGKNAVTHFRVVERFEQYTLVELQLETGRTHQIRVHMKYIGHPLASDPKYGQAKTLTLAGQALHAGVLGFKHPSSGEIMEFEAPIPADIENELNKLRRE